MLCSAILDSSLALCCPHGHEIYLHFCVICRGDVVEVETWCQGEGKVGIRRDWLLTDVITKKRIGRATRCGL